MQGGRPVHCLVWGLSTVHYARVGIIHMLQVHILFGSSSSTDAESPFITILAVDPHIIIRGLEHNLHSQFHESSINGHDYLRTIVQLPLFIQVRSATMASNLHRFA